jgi:hypothetical protein
MRAFICAVGLALSTSAAGAAELYILPDGPTAMVVDKATQVDQGATKLYWGYSFLYPPKRIGTVTTSVLAGRFEVDCKVRKVREISEVEYSGNGRVLVSGDYVLDWASSPPGSAGDQAMSLVCDDHPAQFIKTPDADVWALFKRFVAIQKTRKGGGQ